MYILDNTNQFITYVIDVLQVVVLVFFFVKFFRRRDKNILFLKVYSLLLSYLCFMGGIKFMYDFTIHADEWYRPYIISSLMLVPILEGLMYSLYRQGTTFDIVVRRIIKNECPFMIMSLLTLIWGYQSWFKIASYAYVILFSSVAFVITLVRVRLFSRQVKQAYADADERGLMWIRPIFVSSLFFLITFVIAQYFVFAWVRIAFDATCLFFTAGVSYYLLKQKPINSKIVDDTRMFLQGDMVDKVQVRVLDSKGNHEFVNISEILSRDDMVSLGKQLDKFMSTSVDCLKHDFSIAELAEKMGVDNVCLSCYLSNELELDFYTYVNDFRIDHASRLLKKDKTLSIDDVCERVGFYPKDLFLKLFKQRYNCSPEDYRDDSSFTSYDVFEPLHKVCKEKRPHFVERLKEIEPELTDVEVAYCLLIILGYTNERAAHFLGTTVKSVEIAQCRLRSKLGLLHTDTLEAFLQSL